MEGSRYQKKKQPKLSSRIQPDFPLEKGLNWLNSSNDEA
jgi:hypothetical protein